jgi:hypothetical protein
MSKISHVTVDLDGDPVTGFSKFKENEIEEAQEVDTMDGTDTVDVNPKYGFSLTYLPDSGADREWLGTKNATTVVQYTGGKKVTYTGCRLMKQTPNELDGKAAKEYVLEFHASARKVS